MQKKLILIMRCFSLLILACSSLVHAGQVVTDEMRTWARDAIAQEKSLVGVAQDNTVAVLYFQNLTERQELDPLRKGMTVMLITDLAKIKELRVLERVRIQALVEEIGMGSSGIVEKGTAPQVGKFLKAQYLVGGDLGQGKKADLTVSSDLLDVPSESLKGQAASEGMVEELFRVEKELLFAIVKSLGFDLTPEKKKELQEPLSTNYGALFAFFQGIDASDRGEFGKAQSYYKKALDLDPKLFLAADAVQELDDLGLLAKKTGAGGRGKTYLRELRDRASFTDSLTPLYPVKRIRTPDQIQQREDLLNDLCPDDAGKTAPGLCGCGVADVDSDQDGAADCLDLCPDDPAKTEPGAQGCGVPETKDLCPDDPLKTEPGLCGCGVADIDTDQDGTVDCLDLCPNDPNKVEPGLQGCGEPETEDLCPDDPLKTEPGVCGCGVADTDLDNDTTLDCHDSCPNDPLKTEPAVCGCGVPDVHSDNDGVLDCLDGCPFDSFKTEPGICGCGTSDGDSDQDGVINCFDGCPSDSAKTDPGVCGCGVSDTLDSDEDGTVDCLDGCPFNSQLTEPDPVDGCGGGTLPLPVGATPVGLQGGR
ncbi:MAG: hypothetical protein HY885_04210 [Deltaproteobacteria bacterium]|nr:hypothetical protein [Deltaproteobacteria bacterium]